MDIIVISSVQSATVVLEDVGWSGAYIFYKTEDRIPTYSKPTFILAILAKKNQIEIEIGGHHFINK